MATPVVRFTLKNAKFVRKGLESLRKKIPLVSRSRIRAILVEIKRELSKPGKKRPKWAGFPYINWDSEKQRKAFFASNGFGAGIPTKRTHAHRRSWKIVAVRDGYDFGNELNTAKHIYGTPKSVRRSKIHNGYWPLQKIEVDKGVKKLPKTVKDHLVQTAKREGFETK